MPNNLSKSEEFTLAITTAIISSTTHTSIGTPVDRHMIISHSIETYQEVLKQVEIFRDVFKS